MLRKLTHITLVLFMLVASTGISFSMHYCGGKLVSASISEETKSCCNDLGGCCNDKVLHFEIKNDYVSPVQIEQVKTIELELFYPVVLVHNSEWLTLEEERAIYAKNCVPPPPTNTVRQSLLQTYLC